jgi:Zn2+/Cd2+-exporting ATPase
MKQTSLPFSWLEAQWRDLQRRRMWLSLITASLIAAGLAAGWLEARNLQYYSFLAAALLAGADIAVRAWRSLLNRHTSIELLVTIAAAGALWLGDTWEAAAVTFLFVFGAFLEARTLSRTRQVLGSLLDLAPNMAIVQRDGQQVEVAPHEVQPGETVLVRSGMKIPVDGEVVKGYSAVDESAITGEPVPEEKSPGEKVFAGTVNGNGMLHVHATGIGADTTLARIIRRVEEAQEEKAPTQRFIERFARWYTPAIILMSAAFYLFTRDARLALTLLVIACPGALVISTPVSIVAGIGRAARAGILIKGGEHLENAGKISAVAFDKTGTLTQGRPVLVEIVPLQAEKALAGYIPPQPQLKSSRWSQAQAEVLRWAAAAEAGSDHPLARAVVQAAGDAFDSLPHTDRSESLPGKGVLAQVEGQEVRIGSAAWLEAEGINVDEEALRMLDGMKASGQTAVAVSVGSQAVGLLAIADTLRQEAAEMLRQVKSAGVSRLVMLTGDDVQTARAIAAQAGVEEVRAGLLPEEKLAEIRSLQREGYKVAMIGDGINDAPALAAADIGIAMGAAGSDVAIETADIALMTDDLMKIPEAVRLSRATLRNIHQNVFIALATVSLLLAGVVLGRVHMSGGMLIHEISVLVVILNGMRLMRMR